MIVKEITCFGKRSLIACDGKCNKAWGMNGHRPRIQFDPDDPDDFAYYSDDFLGEAPEHSDVWECCDTKPSCSEDRLNKWCARECERSVIVENKDNSVISIELPDFSSLHYNIPSKHPSA